MYFITYFSWHYSDLSSGYFQVSEKFVCDIQDIVVVTDLFVPQSVPFILRHLLFHEAISIFSYFCHRFPEGAAHFHEEEKEGLVRICQLAIHKKYPKFATDGYEVLYPRPPVIYISASAKHNLGQYLCHQVQSKSMVSGICQCKGKKYEEFSG